MKKALSLILTLAMILTLAPVSQAFSDAYGSEVWQEDTLLYYGTTLSDNIYWSHYYSQLRHEYFVRVAPDSGLTPQVAYGASVCGCKEYLAIVLGVHYEHKLVALVKSKRDLSAFTLIFVFLDRSSLDNSALCYHCEILAVVELGHADKRRDLLSREHLDDVYDVRSLCGS